MVPGIRTRAHNGIGNVSIYTETDENVPKTVAQIAIPDNACFEVGLACIARAFNTCQTKGEYTEMRDKLLNFLD